MNQLAGRLLLGGAVFFLGGCSDDDGIDILPKGQIAVAGSGGSAGGGAGGSAGSGGASGSAGTGGSGGSAEPPDAGIVDSCTPVFLDGGVVSDAGADAGDAGDGGPVSSNGPVSFAADIHPILRAKCVPCHETQFSGGHNVAAADVTEAYEFVKDIKGSLVDRVNGGGMPPPPICNGVPGDPGCISVAELRLIQRWAAQCFPQ
jgi:hypothetical protein